MKMRTVSYYQIEDIFQGNDAALQAWREQGELSDERHAHYYLVPVSMLLHDVNRVYEDWLWNAEPDSQLFRVASKLAGMAQWEMVNLVAMSD